MKQKSEDELPHISGLLRSPRRPWVPSVKPLRRGRSFVSRLGSRRLLWEIRVSRSRSERVVAENDLPPVVGHLAGGESHPQPHQVEFRVGFDGRGTHGDEGDRGVWIRHLETDEPAHVPDGEAETTDDAELRRDVAQGRGGQTGSGHGEVEGEAGVHGIDTDGILMPDAAKFVVAGSGAGLGPGGSVSDQGVNSGETRLANGFEFFFFCVDIVLIIALVHRVRSIVVIVGGCLDGAGRLADKIERGGPEDGSEA